MERQWEKELCAVIILAASKTPKRPTASLRFASAYCPSMKVAILEFCGFSKKNQNAKFVSVKVTRPACNTRTQQRMEDNETLLTELNKKKAWFHAKKIGPVFALQVSQDREIQTLEGREVARAGDMLCRGIAGELWPQTVRTSLHLCHAISLLILFFLSKEERLLSKYKPTNTLDGEWRKYIPRPDLPGVFAARVRADFEVQTSYGSMHGKAGDYLLKDFGDQYNEYPDNVWVVDKKLFNKTYIKVLKPEEVVLAAQVMGVVSISIVFVSREIYFNQNFS